MGDRFGPGDIEAAHGRIPVELRDSPQFVHDGLSSVAHKPVIVKVETANPIRTFKGRGTWLCVAGLAEERRATADRAVVAASTGNFGQGVAYAARAHGVRAAVYAHAAANPHKLERIEALGAEVVRAGRDFDEAREAAEERARAEGWTLLVDGEDPRIAVGAGTLALEVTRGTERGELPAVETAWVPVGNGSLISGVGTWLRSGAPGSRVVGVQSDAAPSMALSWHAGRPIETEAAATYAEGIATRVPVPEALEDMRGVVDAIALVDEDAIRSAQRDLADALGITVEGAASAAWAALLRDDRDGPALLIVTGSNAEQ